MAESEMTGAEEVFSHCRETMKQERQMKREKLFNRRRGILKCRNHIGVVTAQEMKTTANRIKQKSQVSVTDLKILACGFIQNETYINTFVSNTSALHALVRELTGGKMPNQIAATDCIINLSLGDDHSCLRVAKAASPYLIINAKSTCLGLEVGNIWALGNLLGSGLKTWELINAQGVLPTLVNALVVCHQQDLIAYALMNYVNIGWKTITKEDYKLIVSTLAGLKTSSPEGMGLLFMLSTLQWCDNSVGPVFLNSCFEAIDKHVYEEKDTRMLTAAIRCLANFAAEPSGKCAIEIINRFSVISKAFDCVLIKVRGNYANCNSYIHLVDDIGWVIGNLLNHPSEFVELELQSIEDKINEMETTYLQADTVLGSNVY